MAMPATVPAEGTTHREDGEDFIVVDGEWLRKPDSKHVEKYRLTTGRYWGRMGLSHPLTSMLRLRGAVRFADTADVALTLFDNGTNPLDLRSASGYGHIEWGSGGEQESNWQGMRNFTGTNGITLNGFHGGWHLKKNYTYEIECDIYRVTATECAVRSRMYYYSDNSTALYSMAFVHIPHPIESIRSIGLRTTSKVNIHTMRFHVEYW